MHSCACGTATAEVTARSRQSADVDMDANRRIGEWMVWMVWRDESEATELQLIRFSQDRAGQGRQPLACE